MVVGSTAGLSFALFLAGTSLCAVHKRPRAAHIAGLGSNALYFTSVSSNVQNMPARWRALGTSSRADQALQRFLKLCERFLGTSRSFTFSKQTPRTFSNASHSSRFLLFPFTRRCCSFRSRQHARGDLRPFGDVLHRPLLGDIQRKKRGQLTGAGPLAPHRHRRLLVAVVERLAALLPPSGDDNVRRTSLFRRRRIARLMQSLRTGRVHRFIPPRAARRPEDGDVARR